LSTAVGCARWHAKLVLREWGLTKFSELVELLVSEASVPATGLSLRSLRAARDLSRPRAWMVPASPALSSLDARWETSSPPGPAGCGPLLRGAAT
jgi:hypothetical protein